VLAAQNGTVTFAGWHSEGGGNTIDIAHAGSVTSTYMHLSLIAVKPGAQVKQGQPIGVLAYRTNDRPAVALSHPG
jgi:murein DD-endopeptidase MepM/ murein hydrolase activator NlpD